MLKITTYSGRVYLVDETDGAEPRFKRIIGRFSPYVSEDLNGKWLPLLEGSRFPIGSSAVFKYGERDTQYILTTEVVSVEEIPDEEDS